MNLVVSQTVIIRYNFPNNHTLNSFILCLIFLLCSNPLNFTVITHIQMLWLQHTNKVYQSTFQGRNLQAVLSSSGGLSPARPLSTHAE